MNAAAFWKSDPVRQSTAEQLLRDAVAAQRRGSSEDAKRLYASVLRIDPANAAAYGNLAIIAAQQGDFAGAERLIRREVELLAGPSGELPQSRLGSAATGQITGGHRRASPRDQA